MLFILDANAGFGTAVEAYRARTARPARGAPCPALLVGIGHAGEAPYDPAARAEDYTPPGTDTSSKADAFLDFIETALLPALEERHLVNRAELGLVGHSLGGLFATHALLTRPGLFRRLVVASPSLWWNNGAVLEAARRLAMQPAAQGHVQASDRDVRVLVAAGSLEEDGTGPRGAVRADRRMIGRARELAALLQESGLNASFYLFPGDDHGAARISAVVRAVRFGLPTVEEMA